LIKTNARETSFIYALIHNVKLCYCNWKIKKNKNCGDTVLELTAFLRTWFLMNDGQFFEVFKSLKMSHTRAQVQALRESSIEMQMSNSYIFGLFDLPLCQSVCSKVPTFWWINQSIKSCKDLEFIDLYANFIVHV